MTDFSNIDVILCAHGDKRGAKRDSNLIGLAENISAELGLQSCEIALLSEEGAIESALEKSKSDMCFIAPMIFSDGYFYKKIQKAIKAIEHEDVSQKRVLLPPLCDWPELARDVNAHSPEGEILLVAHGSIKTAASRLANERLAQRLTREYGRLVECAYLEEEPFAEEVVLSQKATRNIIGLFMGNGLHGAEDWQEVLSKSPTEPKTAYTIGGMVGIAELVRDKIIATVSDKLC